MKDSGAIFAKSSCHPCVCFTKAYKLQKQRFPIICVHVLKPKVASHGASQVISAHLACGVPVGKTRVVIVPPLGGCCDAMCVKLPAEFET